LSADETGFLVRQVLSWVPRQGNAMMVLLGAFADGKTTPPDLTTTVPSSFPGEWTQSMVLRHIRGCSRAWPSCGY
jgi:hypothetical protein